MRGPHRQLDRPPISEVVCGFIFESTPLDVLDFGVYAEQRKADFPQRELRPALADRLTLAANFVGSGLRTWLISEDEQFVLQLQSDRLYLNWRRRAGRYPRFSTHADRRGLKVRALKEFELFEQFASARAGAGLTLRHAELTKIDHLKRGEHYEDSRDLGELLKVAKVFEDIAASESTQLRLQLREESDHGELSVTISVAQEGAQIHTRHLFEPGPDLSRSFDSANDRINDVFFGLIEPERFGTAEAYLGR